MTTLESVIVEDVNKETEKAIDREKVRQLLILKKILMLKLQPIS